MALVLGGYWNKRGTRLILAVKLKTNPHPHQDHGDKKQSQRVFLWLNPKGLSLFLLFGHAVNILNIKDVCFFFKYCWNKFCNTHCTTTNTCFYNKMHFKYVTSNVPSNGLGVLFTYSTSIFGCPDIFTYIPKMQDRIHTDTVKFDLSVPTQGCIILHLYAISTEAQVVDKMLCCPW